MRIVGGILTAGLLAGSAGCGPAAHDVTGEKSPSAATAASGHPSETLSPLLQEKLPGVKGRTFTSAVVDFPPNARAVPHRHGEAFVYAYVLAGSVRSRLDGEPVRTYQQGQNWVEQPGAHHVLTENTSRTRPAKLLVVFVSSTGDPLKIPDPEK
ncbi:cupin domain-containing protein [Streptomyces gibsoniae]|uniref:Cupin domain-containing protein n=1 Tax=Streptomyces gibsoniae TaxID=3075529 RepID=A0ABU2U7R6_9ACTN|nr:cupin domain-containing protein [Streptomyces sp. DSM 41699]MDT0469280.1 cupin domain-containing protein [Streptomyces sp. DSM 41699]